MNYEKQETRIDDRIAINYIAAEFAEAQGCRIVQENLRRRLMFLAYEDGPEAILYREEERKQERENIYPGW